MSRRLPPPTQHFAFFKLLALPMNLLKFPVITSTNQLARIHIYLTHFNQYYGVDFTSGPFFKELFDFCHQYKLRWMRRGFSTPLLDFLIFRYKLIIYNYIGLNFQEFSDLYRLLCPSVHVSYMTLPPRIAIFTIPLTHKSQGEQINLFQSLYIRDFFPLSYTPFSNEQLPST